ncbi:MAG: asparagine synthase (glutamine-hydrolyzing) [Lentisphaerae bacterium GWF2_45_14]|nr:MAG: asparagine synthase (glutamine-hydrolyzing) [Lentisphaerae bacterium GWF2_45_14]
MCGICGIITDRASTVEESRILEMMRLMKHRGPDDQGVFTEKNVGLGHVRLSILDLSTAGRQPMVSDDGRWVLVFNGEIYNYIEIREKLRGRFNFKTGTDSEVLLNAYIMWGESCLDHFNGMFAFAVYDRHENSIFAARDRFGIKPFYYSHSSESFIFASDIPSVLSAMPNKPEPDNQTVYDYLAFDRVCHTEQTFFKGVKKLQHGHCLSLKKGQLSIRRWYSLPDSLKKPFSGPDELRESLEDAVALRLRSDVPVGACLSGGLDSSAIVSIMLDKFQRHDLNTFSAVYERGMRGDETPFIMEYKDSVKNMFFSRPSAEGLYADMDRLFSAHSEPIPGTSAYAEFKVMETAKEHVTVILNGQGADEEMAGYHYFFGMLYKELFTSLKWVRMINEMLAYRSRHKSFLGLAAFAYFMMPGFLKNLAAVRGKGYIKRDFKNSFSGSDAIVNELYGTASLHDCLLQHFEHKLEHHLIWGDRSSMWFSLELRFPFLDYRFVERVFSLTSGDIIKSGETKHIFREAMKGVIPEVLRKRQDKVGFSTPEDEWFRRPEFRNMIEDILSSSHFAGLGYIDPAAARALYREHLSGKRDISREIWKWVNLDKWSAKYLKGQSDGA